MLALREVVHLKNNELSLKIQVPDELACRDVEVLIFPATVPQEATPHSRTRVLGLFKNKIRMADDFDSELGDSFWTGEE